MTIGHNSCFFLGLMQVSPSARSISPSWTPTSLARSPTPLGMEGFVSEGLNGFVFLFGGNPKMVAFLLNGMVFLLIFLETRPKKDTPTTHTSK